MIYWLVIVWWLMIDWWLIDDWLMIDWRLIDDWLMINWWLINDGLMTDVWLMGWPYHSFYCVLFWQWLVQVERRSGQIVTYLCVSYTCTCVQCCCKKSIHDPIYNRRQWYWLVNVCFPPCKPETVSVCVSSWYRRCQYVCPPVRNSVSMCVILTKTVSVYVTS